MTATAVSVTALLALAAERLAGTGAENPRREARLLLCLATGHPLEWTLAAGDTAVPAAARDRFLDLVARRSRGEPMARLRGTQEFWSLSFALGPETLIPRPDSEALVEAALELIAPPGEGIEVLDLGTGTGCLLLAVLEELPSARGTGIDISEGAVAVARDNAAALGLASRCAFHVADWREGPAALAGQTFDLVLCNPPYVPDGEIDALAPEVAKFEPRCALSGGGDGLDPLRALMPLVAAVLRPGGHLVVELGAGQWGKAVAIVCAVGLDVVGKRNDLSGIVRCLVAKVATVRRRPAENAWNSDFPTLR
ncbi:MAG: peptide chain release factor N(5)-glutamine methyltransferase [Acetobacterales bacterium]